MNDITEKVLKMLAAQEGGALALDQYEDRDFGRYRLKKAEAVPALGRLVEEGLVATIYERLDGPMYALSQEGRKIMADRGYSFDGVRIEKTRKLFREWLCKTPL